MTGRGLWVCFVSAVTISVTPLLQKAEHSPTDTSTHLTATIGFRIAWSIAG